MADGNLPQSGVELQKTQAEGEKVNVTSTEEKNDDSILGISRRILRNLVEVTSDFMDVFWDCEEDESITDVMVADRTGAEGEGHPVSDVSKRPQFPEVPVLPTHESQESDIPSIKELFATCEEYAEEELKPSEEQGDVVDIEVKICEDDGVVGNLSMERRYLSTSSVFTENSVNYETTEDQTDNSDIRIFKDNNIATFRGKESEDQASTTEENTSRVDEIQPVPSDNQAENNDNIDEHSKITQTSNTESSAASPSQADNSTQETALGEEPNPETQGLLLEECDSDQLNEDLEAFMKSLNGAVPLEEATEYDIEEVSVIKEAVRKKDVVSPSKKISVEAIQDDIKLVRDYSEGSLISFHIDTVDQSDQDEQEIIEYCTKEDLVKKIHLRPEKPLEVKIIELSSVAVRNSGRISEDSINVVDSSNSSSRDLNTNATIVDMPLQNEGDKLCINDESRDPSYSRLHTSTESISSGTDILESSSTDSEKNDIHSSDSAHDGRYSYSWENSVVSNNKQLPSLTFTVQIRKTNYPMARNVENSAKEKSRKTEIRKLRYPWNQQLNPPTDDSHVLNGFPEVAHGLGSCENMCNKTSNGDSATRLLDSVCVEFRQNEQGTCEKFVDDRPEQTEVNHVQGLSSCVTFDLTTDTQSESPANSDLNNVTYQPALDNRQSESSESTNLLVKKNSDHEDDCKIASNCDESVGYCRDSSSGPTENKLFKQNSKTSSCETNADSVHSDKPVISTGNISDSDAFWQHYNHTEIEMRNTSPGRDSIDVQRLGFMWENFGPDIIISSIPFSATPLDPDLLDRLAQITGQSQEIPRIHGFIPGNSAQTNENALFLGAPNVRTQVSHEEMIYYNGGLNDASNYADSINWLDSDIESTCGISHSESNGNVTAQNGEPGLEDASASTENKFEKISIDLYDSHSDNEGGSAKNAEITLSATTDDGVPQDEELNEQLLNMEKLVANNGIELENRDSGYETMISNSELEITTFSNSDLNRNMERKSSSQSHHSDRETAEDHGVEVSDESKPVMEYHSENLKTAITTTDNVVQNMSAIISVLMQAQKMAEDINNDSRLTDHINHELNLIKHTNDNCVRTLSSEFIFSYDTNVLSNLVDNTDIKRMEESGGLDFVDNLQQEDENEVKAEECALIEEICVTENVESFLKSEIPTGTRPLESHKEDSEEMNEEKKNSQKRKMTLQLNEILALELSVIPAETDPCAQENKAVDIESQLSSVGTDTNRSEVSERNEELENKYSEQAEGDSKPERGSVKLPFINSCMKCITGELGDTHTSRCHDRYYCECMVRKCALLHNTLPVNEQNHREMTPHSTAEDSRVNVVDVIESSEIQGENQINAFKTIENKEYEIIVTEEAGNVKSKENLNALEEIITEQCMDRFQKGKETNVKDYDIYAITENRLNALEKLEITENIMENIEAHQQMHQINVEEYRESQNNVFETLEIAENFVENLQADQDGTNIGGDESGIEALANYPMPPVTNSCSTECQNQFSEETISDHMIKKIEDRNTDIQNKSVVTSPTKLDDNSSEVIFDVSEDNEDQNKINDVGEAERIESDDVDNKYVTGGIIMDQTADELHEMKEMVRQYQKLVENVFTDIENEIEKQSNESEIQVMPSHSRQDIEKAMKMRKHLNDSLNLTGNHADLIKLRIGKVRSKSDTIFQGTEPQPYILSESAGKMVKPHYASTEISEEHRPQVHSVASVTHDEIRNKEENQAGTVTKSDSEWTNTENALSKDIVESSYVSVVQGEFLENSAASEANQECTISENSENLNQFPILENALVMLGNTNVFERTNNTSNETFPLFEEIQLCQEKQEMRAREEWVEVANEVIPDQESNQLADFRISVQDRSEDNNISVFTEISNVLSEVTNISVLNTVHIQNQPTSEISNYISNSESVQISHEMKFINKVFGDEESLKFDVTEEVSLPTHDQISNANHPSIDGQEVLDESEFYKQFSISVGYKLSDVTQTPHESETEVDPIQKSGKMQIYKDFQIFNESDISSVQICEEASTHIHISEANNVSNDIPLDSRDISAESEVSGNVEGTLRLETEIKFQNDLEKIETADADMILQKEQENRPSPDISRYREENGSLYEEPQNLHTSDVHPHETNARSTPELDVSECEEAMESTDADVSEGVEIQSTISRENMTTATED